MRNFLRTPKLQLVAEQPFTGECWIPPEKKKPSHVQGQRRSPSKMVGVARGHQRADTLKPYSQKTSQSNHTRTTALSNSMKPSHACGATQDWWVLLHWREGNGKPLQYSCLENPMNNMKRQNDRILKRYSPDQWVPNKLLEFSGEITLERMKGWSQTKNNTQLWM